METKKYVECQVCGGKDYRMEGGFYYCTECHTQTQELREEVYDLGQTGDQSKIQLSQIKIPKTKSKSTKKWSTYEGYNLILIGLVNEMIALDASPKIKFTTLQLWTAYLGAIKVAFISKDDAELPKLSAIFKLNDAQSVYGLRPRKRTRSLSRKSSASSKSESGSASETTSTVYDSIRNKRRATKMKRELAKAEYEINRANIDLDSVSYSEYSQRSSSDASNDVSKCLQFNDEAKKQRLRLLSPDHYEEHCADGNLTCHKITARKISSDYLHGPHHLTLTKLYAILYLALLVNKSEIQLGDIIRFIREGHLSYTNVKHLFPEEMALDAEYQKLFEFRQGMFTHENFRRLTAKIAKLIGVSLDECPNIENLCRRYLKELYLPEKFMDIIENLINIAPPDMTFTGTESTMPNYEARAMAYILFTLKLYFGLDDVTEHQISDLAKRLNQMNLIRHPKKGANDSFELYSTELEDDLRNLDIPNDFNNRFFIWDEWVEYIECRKLVISKHHLPTKQRYFPYDMTGGDLLVNFWNEQKSKTDFYEENQYNANSFIYKNIFEKLDQLSDPKETVRVNFKASIQPFSSYVLKIKETFDVPKILRKNFPDLDIEFVTDADNFIDKHNLTNVEKVKMRQFQEVKTVSPFVHDQRPLNNSSVKVEFRRYKSESLLGLINEQKQMIPNIESGENKSTDGNSLTFYYPYLYYWIYFGSVSRSFKNHEFDAIRKNFSDSFNWLLTECSNMIEMMPKDLYNELIMIETYLGYVVQDKMPPKDGVLYIYEKLIKKSKRNW